MHAILRKALRTAVNDQLTSQNVASLVEPPRVLSKEVHPLTPTEARKFLEFIAGDRLECLFTVAVSLGLRQDEAMALRPEDVGLEAGKLRVSYSLRRQKGAIHLGEPKTKKGRRTVDLPSVTLNAIANHIARQEEERHCVDRNGKHRKSSSMARSSKSAFSSPQRSGRHLKAELSPRGFSESWN